MNRWLILALLPLIAGCSTLVDATGPDGPHVYGGVRAIANGEGFAPGYARIISGVNVSSPGDLWGGLFVGAVILSPIVIDWTLSAVTDTLLLPFTLGD